MQSLFLAVPALFAFIAQEIPNNPQRIQLPSKRKTFIQDVAPYSGTSSENTYLKSIKVSASGRLLAVGRRYTSMIGGAQKKLLVLEKSSSNGVWTETPSPALGIPPWGALPTVYQELKGSAFLPNHPDDDYFMIGEFEPNPQTAADRDGVILRYHRSSGIWEEEWRLSAKDFGFKKDDVNYLVHLSDIAVDPNDDNRFFIVGYHAPYSPSPNFQPLLAEFRADSGNLTILKELPSIPGASWHQPFSVTAMPNGSFFVAGTSFPPALFQGQPLFLMVDEANQVSLIPNPTSLLPSQFYNYIYDAEVLPDGRILAVGSHLDDSNVGLEYCLALEFDPGTGGWSLLNPMNPGPLNPNGARTNELLAITVAPNGIAYAVGRTLDYNSSIPGYFYQSLVQRYDGSSWKELSTPSSFQIDPTLQPYVLGFGPQLWDVTVHPSGTLFAAGFFQTKTSLIPNFFNSALVLKR